MTASDIRLLLDYHYWARNRILDAAEKLTPEDFLRDRGNSFASIRDTLAHMYFAEWAWYSRWHGNSPSALPKADQFQNLPSLRDAWTTLERDLRAFIDPIPDSELDRVIEYRLFSGISAASPIWQMVQHVVNHATYHRGQVTTMIRQAGAAPPASTDLITFYRERRAS